MLVVRSGSKLPLLGAGDGVSVRCGGGVLRVSTVNTGVGDFFSFLRDVRVEDDIDETAQAK